MMKVLINSAVFISILIPFIASADYLNLVGLPHLEETGDQTTEQYVNALYLIAIGLAAMLAVGRLIFAGAKYILTDVVTQKGAAKKDIQNVLIGLAIVLSAVLILNTINPQLTQLDALAGIKPIERTIETTPSSGFGDFEFDTLGGTTPWDSLTEEQKTAFENNCDGDVVLTTNNAGTRIGVCAVDPNVDVDINLVTNTEFNTDTDDFLDLFLNRDSNNQLSNQMGTTIQPGDVKGYVTLESVPGDDENAFAPLLLPDCQAKGGSHVLGMSLGNSYEFWCFGNQVIN